MERPQADQPRDDADDAGADDRQTPEQFADELESDPAHNPPIDELRDLKGG
jgi:hypothetical protein